MSMDYQKAFNQSIGGLIEQGRYAEEGEAGHCVMQNDEGCKCAVGMLMPDEMFPEHNRSSLQIVMKDPIFKELWKYPEREKHIWNVSDLGVQAELFFCNLQALHDQQMMFDPHAIELEACQGTLAFFEERYGIDTSILRNFWERQRDKAET